MIATVNYSLGNESSTKILNIFGLAYNQGINMMKDVLVNEIKYRNTYQASEAIIPGK